MAQRTTLVTGTTRGIGQAIANRLTADGHEVIGLARGVPDNPVGPHYTVDLTDALALKETMKEITAKHKITTVVHNAGYSRPQSVEETTLDVYDDVMAINLRAMLLVVQPCIAHMKAAGGGRIASVSARAALGKEMRTAYSAAKAGQLGFTRTWALELARHNITVNAVAPGPIGTDLFRSTHPEGSPELKEVEEGTPLNRLGTPEDVAGAIAFFVSDDASFITGQVLYVCGGRSVGSAPIW
ncbi:MAG: SDR family oxidoreductase [Proteobacteria bacterium]|nr:SDR family oxidoreductase [Pseudomonadota bacterium]